MWLNEHLSTDLHHIKSTLQAQFKTENLQKGKLFNSHNIVWIDVF